MKFPQEISFIPFKRGFLVISPNRFSIQPGVCVHIYMHMCMYICTCALVHMHTRIYIILNTQMGMILYDRFTQHKEFLRICSLSLSSVPPFTCIPWYICCVQQSSVTLLKLLSTSQRPSSWQADSILKCLWNIPIPSFFKHFTLCQNAILDSFDQIGFLLKKPVVKTAELDTFLNMSNSLQISQVSQLQLLLSFFDICTYMVYFD